MQSFKSTEPVFRLSALVLVGTLAGCAGLAAAAPFLLKIGQNLLGTAQYNYDKPYANEVRELLVLLSDGSRARTEFSSAPRPENAPALALDVAILRQRPSEAAPSQIEDGDVVFDGDGDDLAADRLKVSVRSNLSCYVYVVSIDATGWVTPVFPSAESGFQNPVPAGSDMLIPEGRRWFALDARDGVESFYFLASHTPRPDLEALLASFATKTRPKKTEYRSVSQPAIASRGIHATGEGSQSAVATPNGASHEFVPTEFLAHLDGFDLVVTRWFEHR